VRRPRTCPWQRDHSPRFETVQPDDLKGGTLKLTDFGIAKGADLTALTDELHGGHGGIHVPEQCRGEKTVSAKSDLYSMGVVFYELLTGRKPFQAESPIEMFQPTSPPV